MGGLLFHKVRFSSWSLPSMPDFGSAPKIGFWREGLREQPARAIKMRSHPQALKSERKTAEGFFSSLEHT